MSAGPLRQITAATGLLAVAPVAAMLLTSALTPEEAVMRALLAVTAVLVVGQCARVVLTSLLRQVEREVPADGPVTRQAPRRRHDDRPVSQTPEQAA